MNTPRKGPHEQRSGTEHIVEGLLDGGSLTIKKETWTKVATEAMYEHWKELHSHRKQPSIQQELEVATGLEKLDWYMDRVRKELRPNFYPKDLGRAFADYWCQLTDFEEDFDEEAFENHKENCSIMSAEWLNFPKTKPARTEEAGPGAVKQATGAARGAKTGEVDGRFATGADPWAIAMPIRPKKWKLDKVNEVDEDLSKRTRRQLHLEAKRVESAEDPND